MAKKQPTHIEFTHPCPKPPPCVLFDLDGTLVDTVPLIAACYNAGLKATGHRPMKTNDIAAILGPPLERLFALRVEKHQVADACRAYRETFENYFREHVKPMSGAHELLDALRQRGIKTGLCTNRHRHVQDILDLCQLTHRLDAVVAITEEGDHPKPDPEMLYRLMEQLDAIPAETAYVGDSIADMAAGRAANLWTIGLLTLGVEAHRLEGAGAHVVALDLTALPLVLGLIAPPTPPPEPEPIAEAAPAELEPVAVPAEATPAEPEAATTAERESTNADTPSTTESAPEVPGPTDIPAAPPAYDPPTPPASSEPPQTPFA